MIPESIPRIVSDPSIMHGKWCIAGTRITVEAILGKLAAGETIDVIEREIYPHIKPGSVREAIEWVIKTLAKNSLREQL